MSRGPGKIQRAIAALIEAEPGGAWPHEDLAERIYGTPLFTRAQKSAIGRAIAAMRLPGTWAVWRASFNNDRRFRLFDPCNLDSWRKKSQRTGILRTSSRAEAFSTGGKGPSAGPVGLPNHQEQPPRR